MEPHRFFARRKIVISAGLGFFGLIAHFLSLKGSLAKKKEIISFTTRYEVKISHLPGLAGLSSSGKYQISVAKTLFPELNAGWFHSYERVKTEFIESNRLLSSRRVVSEDGNKVIYINTWKNRDEFQRFCEMTSILQLHEKFVAANCDPIFKYS